MIGHLALSQRNYNIQPTDEEIVIDGLLNEDIWKTADVAGDFIIKYPDFGSPSKYKTEMRMTYDSEAFYVAGILYDPKPDSVSYTLSQRDNFGNADWFGFSIDPNYLSRFIAIFTDQIILRAIFIEIRHLHIHWAF